MDPKRVNIKTMKTVEAIDARLARIEAKLGIGPDAIGAPAATPSDAAPAAASEPQKGQAKRG